MAYLRHGTKYRTYNLVLHRAYSEVGIDPGKPLQKKYLWS